MIIGGAENDTINGEEGSDKLDGNDGGDVINGGTGHDTIRGMGDNDILNGEDGNDNIEGGEGADHFVLSKGNDIIKDFVLGTDNIFIDSDIFSEYSTKLIIEDKKAIGVDIFLKEEGSKKSNKTRVLYSGKIAGELDPIFGVEPPPPLPDSGGNNGSDDGLGGGDGDSGGGDIGGEEVPGFPIVPDYCESNPDDESCKTAIDGDVIEPSKIRTVDVIQKPKNSSFDDIQRGSQKPDNFIGGSSIDKITGMERSDILKGKGGDDYLYGDNHSDTLRGGKGEDVLQGGAAKDDLAGGGNSDVLYGGPAADVLTGNGGRDVFVLSPGSDVVTDFKIGKDDIGLVYALSLNLKQKGSDLLIKGDDNVRTLLEGINKASGRPG